jgi:hypothetical protein
MYSLEVRQVAVAALGRGESVSSVARRLGISRAAITAWRREGPEARKTECPRCDGASLDSNAYSALLGFYLGDGCISEAARYHVLRVSCDAKYRRIIDDVSALMHSVRPCGRVFHVRAPGVVVVQSNWAHWPCLFPQHGAGRKHERPIRLEPWQVEFARADPAAVLRGLFHSDGARVANWTRSSVGKRYDYPRWQFTNRSEDIHGLCQSALDLVGVDWTRSNNWTTSVSTRPAVARLDALIGLKA